MFVQVRDLTFHIRIDGNSAGEPLVLLHSLGTEMRVWDPQAEMLAKRFRIVRVDLRGHGLSDVPPGPYTIEEMADDLLAILDKVGIGRCHLAGLSIGGMVAQAAAALQPQRFVSLILCDTALAIPPAALWRERAATVRANGVETIADAVLGRWITPAFAGRPEAQVLRKMLICTAAEGYAGASEAIAAADLSEETRKLRMPTLVLVGDQDEATPVQDALSLANCIPGSRLEIVANASHIPTFEQAAAVSDAIELFLTSLVAHSEEKRPR